METFEIISEQSFKFKEDYIYLITFKAGESYGIEVTNSNASFGKSTFTSLEQVEYIKEILEWKIYDIRDYKRICNLASGILFCDDFRAVVLKLHLSINKSISKATLSTIITMLGLKKTYRRSRVNEGFETIILFENDIAKEANEEYAKLLLTDGRGNLFLGKYLIH